MIKDICTYCHEERKCDGELLVCDDCLPECITDMEQQLEELQETIERLTRRLVRIS